ncbi:MAG TPA: endopeptidase La, partial [Saprospiraceae bacterium]|nr:endopeptidase La [Saprospiraceae bacterium]
MFDNLNELHLIEDEPEMISLFNLDEDDDSQNKEIFPTQVPILALKNTVLFPGIVSPINIGREKSVKSVEKAYAGNKYIGVLAQKDGKVADPNADDLFQIGTLAIVERMLTMPDGSKTAIIRGKKRFTLQKLTRTEPFLEGNIAIREYEPHQAGPAFKALISSIKDKAKEIIDLSPNIPNDAMFMLRNITIDSFLLNFIASNLSTTVEIKQDILNFDNLSEKAQFIFNQMDDELKILRLKSKIEGKVRGDIDKQQRDFFLNQQLKTIQEELGQNPQQEQFEQLEAKAKSKKWPKTVEKVFFKELQRIKRTPPQMAEFSNGLSYLELMLDLPWNEYTEDNFDL